MKYSSSVNTKQVLVLLTLLLALPVTSHAQRKGKGNKAQPEKANSSRSRVSADIDRRAKHLYDKAMELMEYKQYERGLTMLNTVVRDNQGSTLAHMAHMSMGKHYLGLHKNKEALSHFLLLTRLLAPEPGEKQSETAQELYHEALFQAGFSQYQAGQYSACFPLFRRLTEVAGKTKWANKAYYYIGMSHYNLKNWNKAIDSLSLVGTEVEDAGEELGRIEIGQRFYAKIVDADVPVMRKLDQPVTAKITVSSGDTEIITGVPVAGKKHEMLASAPTALGDAKPGDGVLQMIGGDTLTVTYLDDSTMDGKKGVPRTGKVRAVSTGTVGFFLGDYSTPAYIAYPGQPQVLMLRDADLDKTAGAEKVTLTVTSRYKVEAQADAESESTIDIFALEDDEKDVWKERDSITVTLVEISEGPEIRTGIFMGKIKLAPTEQGVEPDQSDAILHTDELDELRVTYTDDVHLYGDDPRESDATIKVSGSVNSGVSADQYVVFDALLKARKSSVEAEALNGLGGIYKDMGLDQRASLRAKEALAKIDPIIINRKKLPGDLVENSFKLKWESELLKSDYQAATSTCLAFNRLYPESVLADQALMTLGRSLADKGDFQKSVESYQRVLQLQNPISAAEAQFRIGEVLQKQAEESIKASDQHNSKWGKAGISPATALQKAMGGAIAAYRKTYETYPESSFAAESLGRVVRHYVNTENFSMAADLLDSVFSDYPDAAFLDEMLLLWSNVGYRMGDNEIAKAKLRQLITDYPSSKHITEARQKLAGIEAESANSNGE
ncbi:MAG: tetratricopeptide repeat protein [Verrucomicrobiae bacterium]|nr:tetratricopeptide repeat protein [Verrucomicrobiae bacterium]NNJ43911.1 tetratricopeptide repeat protein [Akkermansiaceae bacterium]